MRTLALAGDVGGIDPAHPGLLAALAGILGAAIGGFALWLANRLLGKAAFQTAINDGFAKLASAQDRANAKLEKQLTAERIGWAAERATLQGEIRNLMQAVDSLKSELRRHGIPIPLGSMAGREPDAGATIFQTPKDKP